MSEVLKYPKVIYFCNKTLDKMEQFANNWKKLNPEYIIKLYDNIMCREFLVENYGEYYGEVFDFLKDGPIKADFWRACILYKNGGVYSDIDNMPFVPLDKFINTDVEFVTCSAYMGGMRFNPNFIIASKDHILLKKCIEWYINKYKKKDTYSYWEYSIMKAFTDVIKLKDYNNKYGIYYLEEDPSIEDPSMKIQIIEERPGKNHYDAHNVYNDIRVFNNRYPEWDASTHSFR